jgi:uncharacterized protein YjbI with pentapeptide repeats
MKLESLNLRGAVPQVVRPPREVNKLELARIVEQHHRWVESQGKWGEKADLTRAELESVCLSGFSINLQGALLHGTRLRAADLSLSDLREACLAGADLRDTNLLGTRLRGADLQGANLEGARALWPAQLAGTNLAAATLDPGFRFDSLASVAETSRKAHRLFLLLLLACAALVWAVIKTGDAQLVTGSAASPLPLIGRVIPLVEFYLLAPLALLALYVYFHFYLQRLWEGLSTLPAVFPDGDPVDAKAHPWLLTGLARAHFPGFREERASISALEKAIAALFGYWVVPATLLLLWGRYLTRQDLHGTLLQVALVMTGVAFALTLPALAEKTLRAENRPLQRAEKILRRAKGSGRGALVLGLGFLLAVISFGITFGVPHDSSRARGVGPTDVRRWPAYALWLVGYSPFAQLTEQQISMPPPAWSGSEADRGAVEGARLNKASLRYAEAYRAFLVNAHLWQADLRGADLSQADLRGANLQQADLRGADLDRARMGKANLQRASLQKANLARADLHEADLSYAALSGAVLVDAELADANLYSAELVGARMVRARLQKSDLREANLSEADLGLADLRGAYLWSALLTGARLQAAQLQHAFLMNADLRGADLERANLTEAILHGTDLRGARLAGADLRGVRGLTAGQVCDAATRQGAIVDENLAVEVQQQCGAG